MRPVVVLAVVGAIVAAVVIANVALDRTTVRTHTVAGTVNEVIIRSAGGDVELAPGSGLVEVRETRHYVIAEPEVEESLDGGVLTLDGSCRTPVFGCAVDLRVSVPAGVKLTVESDAGDIRARGVDGGSAYVQTNAGDVSLQLGGRQRLVQAQTDAGDVEVIAAHAQTVNAQTNAGDVTVSTGGEPQRIVARTQSGDVRVSVPTGDYAVDTQTSSGDVTVSGIARDDSALRSIQARTDSGDITLVRRLR